MKKQEQVIDLHAELDELLSLKRQLATLADNVEQLRQEMAKQSKALADLAAQVAGAAAPVEATPTAAPTQAAAPHAKEVSPDVLVIISAAVTAFLGKKVRIRSARMLQSPYEIWNPWSQMGRVSVQASHWLRRAR